MWLGAALPPWELHPLAKQSREEQPQEAEKQPSDDGRPSTAPSSQGDFVLAISTAVLRLYSTCGCVSETGGVSIGRRGGGLHAPAAVLERPSSVRGGSSNGGAGGRRWAGDERSGWMWRPTNQVRTRRSFWYTDRPRIFGVSLCVCLRRAVRWLPSSRRAARPRPSRRRPCWPTARWLARRAATAAAGSAARGSRSSGRHEATQSRKRSQCERVQAVYCNNQTQVT